MSGKLVTNIDQLSELAAIAADDISIINKNNGRNIGKKCESRHNHTINIDIYGINKKLITGHTDEQSNTSNSKISRQIIEIIETAHSMGQYFSVQCLMNEWRDKMLRLIYLTSIQHNDVLKFDMIILQMNNLTLAKQSLIFEGLIISARNNSIWYIDKIMPFFGLQKLTKIFRVALEYENYAFIKHFMVSINDNERMKKYFYNDLLKIITKNYDRSSLLYEMFFSKIKLYADNITDAIIKNGNLYFYEKIRESFILNSNFESDNIWTTICSWSTSKRGSLNIFCDAVLMGAKIDALMLDDASYNGNFEVAKYIYESCKIGSIENMLFFGKMSKNRQLFTEFCGLSNDPITT